MSTLQGVCKDCGNGTMNNELFTAFTQHEVTGAVACARCGSTHVDVVGTFYEPEYEEV